MKLLLLALILGITPASTDAHEWRRAAADTLTLEWAYGKALANNPRSAESARQREVGELRARAYRTGERPQIALTGQSVYHSTVAEIPISLPGASVPAVPHNQYRVGLGVSVPIWGNTGPGLNVNLAYAEAEASAARAEVALWSLREAVESAFFGILKAEASLDVIGTLTEELQTRRDQMRAAVAGGIVRGSSVDALSAELIRLSQQAIAARSAKATARQSLEILTGERVGEGVQLNAEARASEAPPRPEYHLFESSRQVLERTSDLVRDRNRPRLEGFGEGAVGRPPGLNVFGDQIEPFFSAGIRLRWSPWDWRAADRNMQAIDTQKQVIEGQREAFEQSVALAASRYEFQIEQYRSLLAADAEIIELRARIAAEAATRLAAGVATGADYVAEVQAEFRARLDQKLHAIQMAEATARLETTTGGNR